jgi:energy-coupling factor transport system substrate-specific component
MSKSLRTLVYAVVIGALTLLIYYIAAVVRGPKVEYVSWSPTVAAVLTIMGLASGAAWGVGGELKSWKTRDAILVANLALVFGLLFLGWAMVWDLVKPLNAIIPGSRDLVYGFWFLAGLVAPYIIRRPGAAVVAETLAALAEWLAGSQWGFTLLISGLIQGGMAEIVFAAYGYKRYKLDTLMIAGAAAGVGSLVVDYFFWYSNLKPGVLLIMLVARLISGAILGGWLAKVIADGLVRSGALGNFPVAREGREEI